MTAIDPWFLFQLDQIYRMELDLAQAGQAADQCTHPLARLNTLSADQLRRAKEYGFSDVQLAFSDRRYRTGEVERCAQGDGHPAGLTSWWIPVRRSFRASTPLLLLHL